MKKRFLSLFLAFVMVLCMVPTVAIAAEESLKVSEITIDGKKGLQVTYTIPNSFTANAIELTIGFDSSKVEAKEIKWNEDFALGEGTYNDNLSTINQDASMTCSWSTSKNKSISANLLLVTAKFAIKEGASGKITFSTKDIVITDQNADSQVTSAGATKNSAEFTPATPVDSITLDFTSLTLTVGENKTLTANVTPETATNKNVTWASSDSKIVAITGSGNSVTVTAKAEGEATITVTTADGGKTAACTITVVNCKHEHTESIAAMDSTCTVKGHEAYTWCEDCKHALDASKNIIEIPYKDLIDHNFAGEVATEEHLAAAATCVAPASYYKSCTMCHKNGTETFTSGNVDSTNHVGNKTYTSNKDDTHQVICASCNTVINASEDCSGGTATCTAKRTCAKCGEEYGELAAHTYDTKWTSDDTGHWHVCTVCKQAPTTKEAHDLTAATCQTPATCKTCGWNDGKTAACTPYNNNRHASDANKHWQVCQWCGKKINENDHTWNEPAEGEAECCTVCGYVKKAATTPCGENQHSRITHQAYDATNHYEICSTCGEKIHSEKHTFEETTVNGKKYHFCRECGYTEEIKTVTPTTPTGNNPNAKNPYTKDNGKTVESGKTFDAGIALYVGLSLLSVTGGALVIGKKKEF